MGSGESDGATMIVVKINGQDKTVAESTTLREYVDSLGVDLQHIAVAHNGTVLRREELPHVVLSEGDRVEIVRAVGGG
jgi:thiamine biosynthesis protein ThiS